MNEPPQIYPELKIKTLRTLLAVLRLPGPHRDIYRQKSGRCVVELRSAAGAFQGRARSGAIVAEQVEKPRRGQYRKRQETRRAGPAAQAAVRRARNGGRSPH